MALQTLSCTSPGCRQVCRMTLVSFLLFSPHTPCSPPRSLSLHIPDFSRHLLRFSSHSRDAHTPEPSQAHPSAFKTQGLSSDTQTTLWFNAYLNFSHMNATALIASPGANLPQLLLSTHWSDHHCVPLCHSTNYSTYTSPPMRTTLYSLVKTGLHCASPLVRGLPGSHRL